MKIEKAHLEDSKVLTELTIRSKDYWNYGPEQIAEWKDELRVTPEYIKETEMYKLVLDDQIIGYYAAVEADKETIKLDNLFIEPDFIRQGYGSILVDHFIQQTKDSSYQRMLLDSDPNAVKFYEMKGFKVIGKLKTSIKDRFLSIMELEIGQ